MAHVVNLPTFTDSRGSLTVIEKILPFEIKRAYFIYNATEERGRHRHHKTIQALFCTSGSCNIFVHNKMGEHVYSLDKPNMCLILEPSDWHTMNDFSEGCVLFVLASEYFDKNDYIAEKVND